MESTIRRASSSDAGAVAELYLRARRAAADRGTIPPPVHDDDDVTGWITDVVIPRLECWLAERASGTLVGMLVLEADWVDQLYVDPDHTSRGIGAELLAVAKHERPEGLRLWTFVSNEEAQRFYLRHGFQEVERTDGGRNEEGAPDIQYAWHRT
jgi:GNAT superfamily N-acetyltransferase